MWRQQDGEMGRRSSAHRDELERPTRQARLLDPTTRAFVALILAKLSACKIRGMPRRISILMRRAARQRQAALTEPCISTRLEIRIDRSPRPRNANSMKLETAARSTRGARQSDAPPRLPHPGARRERGTAGWPAAVPAGDRRLDALAPPEAVDRGGTGDPGAAGDHADLPGALPGDECAHRVPGRRMLRRCRASRGSRGDGSLTSFFGS